MVEDDDSFAQALRTLLEADGRLEVAGRARDGREGIELAEALRPDVVLMDIVLPVMDGVEATREIRRRQPTIAVVGITGSEYEERALEVRDAGASISSARGGSTQTWSSSLSLPHITAGAAGAAAQRAAEQRSSQRTAFIPADSEVPSDRRRHYWPRPCRYRSSFANARLRPPWVARASRSLRSATASAVVHTCNLRVTASAAYHSNPFQRQSASSHHGQARPAGLAAASIRVDSCKRRYLLRAGGVFNAIGLATPGRDSHRLDRCCYGLHVNLRLT